MSEVAMDINQIMEFLPHRYPFLLIDKIIEIVPGEKVVAQKNVTMNEQFFQGHFPGKPVMPGVLIMEALAQAGACVVLSLEENKGKIAYLGAMDKCKFRKQVVPGDVLMLEMEIIKLKKNAGVGKAVALVDGKKVAEAEIMFMIG